MGTAGQGLEDVLDADPARPAAATNEVLSDVVEPQLHWQLTAPLECQRELRSVRPQPSLSERRRSARKGPGSDTV